MMNLDRIKSIVLYLSNNLLRLGALLFLMCLTLQVVFKVDNKFTNSYGFAKEAIAIGGILLIVFLIFELFSRGKNRE